MQNALNIGPGLTLPTLLPFYNQGVFLHIYVSLSFTPNFQHSPHAVLSKIFLSLFLTTSSKFFWNTHGLPEADPGNYSNLELLGESTQQTQKIESLIPMYFHKFKWGSSSTFTHEST